MKSEKCYRCNKEEFSREHFPPKSFFPNRGKDLQLRTVPSCEEHNNGKSNDDIYVLTHICLNASKGGENLPFKRFIESVLPQVNRSKGFHHSIMHGAFELGNGARAYQVDVDRFDNFFDNFVSAIFYDHFKIQLNPDFHNIRHVYLNFSENDELQNSQFEYFNHFAQEFNIGVHEKEFDKIDESVYLYKMIAPGQELASITILHQFYGTFKVISYLTQKVSAQLLDD